MVGVDATPTGLISRRGSSTLSPPVVLVGLSIVRFEATVFSSSFDKGGGGIDRAEGDSAIPKVSATTSRSLPMVHRWSVSKVTSQTNKEEERGWRV